MLIVLTVPQIGTASFLDGPQSKQAKNRDTLRLETTVWLLTGHYHHKRNRSMVIWTSDYVEKTLRRLQENVPYTILKLRKLKPFIRFKPYSKKRLLE